MLSKFLTIRCLLSHLASDVISMQIATRPINDLLLSKHHLAPSNGYLANMSTATCTAIPWITTRLARRRRAHVEDNREHVCAGAILGCGNDRNRTIIQSSMSHQHNHAPDSGQFG